MKLIKSSILVLFIFKLIYLNSIISAEQIFSELEVGETRIPAPPSRTEELSRKIIHEQISIDDFFKSYLPVLEINDVRKIFFRLFFDYRMGNAARKQFFYQYYQYISEFDLPDKDLLTFFQDYWDQDVMHIDSFGKIIFDNSYRSTYEFITSLIKYFAECPEYIDMETFQKVFEFFLTLYNQFIGINYEFILKNNEKKALLNILFDVNKTIVYNLQNRTYIKKMILMTHARSRFLKKFLRLISYSYINNF